MTFKSVSAGKSVAAGLALAAGVACIDVGSADAAAPNSSTRSWSSEPAPKVKAVQVPAVFQPGTIVIVNSERKLYYINGKGTALRYGVAVGKNAELWMGRTFITQKAVDPKWIPVNGDEPVEGGDVANPLGKRAMYLDWSLLRIHGTPSRGSIGSAVSNGCIRMLNEDVIDLFDRVHLGAPVYAIASWNEATKYKSTRVGERQYVDPEAHKEAQDALKEQLAALAEEKKQQARAERLANSRSTPMSWNTRSALGR